MRVSAADASPSLLCPGSESSGASDGVGEAFVSKLRIGAIPVVKSSTVVLDVVTACCECRGRREDVSEFVKVDAMSETLVSASVIVVAEDAILLLTTSHSFKMCPLLASIFRVTVVKASDDVCAACSLIDSLCDVIVCVRVLITSSIVSRRVVIVGVFSKMVVIPLTLSSTVANRCVSCAMVCMA